MTYKYTNKKQTSKQSLNYQAGFTLPELAIVMIIFGLMITTVSLGLTTYQRVKIKNYNQEVFEKTESAIGSYRAIQNVYPCPADPNLGPDDPLYGVAQAKKVDADGNPLICKSWSRFTNEPHNPETPNHPRAAGVDKDGNGEDDMVYYGAVPFRTIINGPDNDPTTEDDNMNCPYLDECYSGALTIDAWNNKLTYAVSEALVNVDSYNDSRGVIDIVDEFGQSTLVEENTAHYVILSHGPNGKGAFTKQGGKTSCTSGIVFANEEDEETADSNDDYLDDDVNPDEKWNCKRRNNTFLAGLHNENTSNSSDRYNDDIIRFVVSNATSNWTYSPNLGIVSTNPGNVAINVDRPLTELHVGGNIEAEQLHARALCDGMTDAENNYIADTTSCMTPSILTDSTIKCGINEVMTGISKGAAICEVAFEPGFLKGKQCPTNQIACGISKKNGVLCRNKNNPVCPDS